MRARTPIATSASSGESTIRATDAPIRSSARFTASLRTEPVDGGAQRIGQRGGDDVGEQLLQARRVGLRVLHVTGARLEVLDLERRAEHGLELADERKEVGTRTEREV